MVIIDDPAKKADEEMEDAASEEHTDEEIQIDESPQTLIPQKDTVQALAASADETASATKTAEEEQTENPQADEIQSSEQNPQDEEHADPTPQTEQEEAIPQPDAQPEQAPQPEEPAAEIPHPEENAEENAPNQDNAFIVLNPETAIVVSPPIPQQNLKPVQRQPFSKRPKFQKENFFEERIELPVPIPSEEAVKLYGERELPNGMMEVPMKPLAEGKSPRTTFLVHELKYTPRPVYRILCSVLAPIKGHDDDEDVVGLMKNILFNIIHGIPINIHDFFLRTLADNAMCPFDHKIYAPWIMRFIRTRTGINFHAECQNHVGYMPPIRVNKKTFEPIEGKGKLVIEEGSRPLDGQFRELEAYSSWDDTETRSASPVPPRLMNTRELLLSLHQKVDRNHKWVKRQFGTIVKTLTKTQNSVKLNHHYLHEVFDRTWATLAHLKIQTELEEMDFERDFEWSWPPKKKFRPIPVPDLEDSSFSSFRTLAR
ncbi:hypothetical protein ZWY2020_025118 [Hordeum vulgare]|nr:hypothetical protein ZWY2020_025118 [Hordeum vulgare]